MDTHVGSPAFEKYLADRGYQNRDAKLPKEALLLFHEVGFPPQRNYKILLMNDGRLFRRDKDPKSSEMPVDDEFPQRPEVTVAADKMEQIRTILKEDFLAMPEIREAPMVPTTPEYQIVLARVDGKMHEVIFRAVPWRLFGALKSAAWKPHDGK